MQRAIIASVLIGIVCSVIGVFVLLRGMVFLGQAIAHSGFAGAALAILLGWNPTLVIMGFSALSAIGIGYVNQKKLMKNEIIIGIVFSFFMALAIIIIGLYDEYFTNIQSILFGQVLLVTREDFILLLIFSALILLVVFLIKKELYFITFNEELAEISGIPVKWLSYTFLIIVSLTIAVSLKTIGAILVFAMIVTPAAAAYQWTYKLNKMIILSVIFGIVSAIVGLFLSFILDIASGSTIVSLVTVIFITSFLLSPKRRSLKKDLGECPFCKDYLPDASGVCQNPSCKFYDIPHVHDAEKVSIRKEFLPLRKRTPHKHEKQERKEKKETFDKKTKEEQ
jgi:ABC-type Mn2+/Zn2+ transport system permease subunit